MGATFPYKPRQQRRAAFHEAGHAVARVGLGLDATDVLIRPDGTGLTHGTMKVLTLDRYGMEDLILVSLAGPAAEARAARCSLLSVWWDGGRVDLAEAKEMIARIAGCFGNDLNRYSDDAKHLVRKHWPAIDRVANALLLHGKLSAQQLVMVAS